MIYLSQFRKFLNAVDNDLERHDWGCWPLSEHGPALEAWLSQHGVTLVDDTAVVDLDREPPVG